MSRLLIVLVGVLLVGCASAPTPTPTPTVTPSSVPIETAAPITETPQPTITPAEAVVMPAIELLAGSPDTCRLEGEEQSTVVTFAVRYINLVSTNVVRLTMTDPDGNLITEDRTPGENKDGEEGWGFYPPNYIVPDNTAITVTMQVFVDDSEASPISSTSVLVYNCTTGETIRTNFEYTNES